MAKGPTQKFFIVALSGLMEMISTSCVSTAPKRPEAAQVHFRQGDGLFRL